MKNVTPILIVLLSLFSSGSFAEENKKIELAKEYLVLSKTKETFDTTIEAYVNQMAPQGSEEDKDELRSLFNEYMGWDALKEPTIKIVANLLSEKELSEINDFYNSQSGKALAESSPQMAAEISNLIGNNLNKAMQNIQGQ